MIVALTTLAAIESWYDESHHVAFGLPEMNEDSTLLWEQAKFQAEAQMKLKIIEQDRYQKHGRLVPEMPTDNGCCFAKPCCRKTACAILCAHCAMQAGALQ
jgi:hypothetical protein